MSEDPVTTIEENKTVVRRFFEELLSTDNLALADEILSPAFRFYFSGSPEPMEEARLRPGSPCVAPIRVNFEVSPRVEMW